MRKIASRFAIVLATVGVTIGLLGAPAEADSSWDCVPAQLP